MIDKKKFTPGISVLRNLSVLINDIHLFHISYVNLTYISNPRSVIFIENPIDFHSFHLLLVGPVLDESTPKERVLPNRY